MKEVFEAKRVRDGVVAVGLGVLTGFAIATAHPIAEIILGGDTVVTAIAALVPGPRRKRAAFLSQQLPSPATQAALKEPSLV